MIDRKKILDEALSDEAGEGFKKLGEVIGEEIRQRLLRWQMLVPRRNLVELTRESLGPVCREDFGKKKGVE